MKKLWAVIKGELKRYFASPVAVVYLLSFLLLNGSFSLYFGGVFTQGEASLRGMFDFIPWIYLLFISGIAMRLWAEEFKSKTILQLVTQPVTINTYVWGKFFAAWGFCLLGLVLTFPLVITVNVLGEPDNGIIVSSYLGAFLLAGAMLAVAQTASAMSRNQVIALVVAVILNLLFFLCGLEYVLGFLRNFCSDYLVDTVASFSFLTIMADFNSGLVKLSNLLFLVSLIVLCNFITVLIVSGKTLGVFPPLKITSRIEMLATIILGGVIFIGVNLWAYNMLALFKADWTSDKLFTPSKSAVEVLKNISSPVTAKVYYSDILGIRDEAVRLNFNNLKQLLQTYHDLAGDNFKYRIYATEPLSDEEDHALSAGLHGLPIKDLNASAYFGMELVNENGQKKVIPFFPLQRKNLLEQDIIENVYLLEHKPLRLGVISGLPIMGEKVRENMISQPWQIMRELEKYYEVKPITQAQDLGDIDLLMMVHPQDMSQNLQDAVYDFSISGGKVLAFFDVMPESLMLFDSRNVNLGSSDYGDLPNRWGFHFYDDVVVADLANSTQIAVEETDYAGNVQDLIQFYITNKEMAQDLPEVSQLKRILVTSASVFMPLKDSLIYFAPLLQSSKISQMMPANVVTKRMHPAEIMRRFKNDEQPKFLAARIISQDAKKPFDLIVVGDADMLYDSFWGAAQKIGKDWYSMPLLDNANFVLNALESLSGNMEMLSLRGKSPKLRGYDKVELENKQILTRYKAKEKAIFDEIYKIKKQLGDIVAKKEFETRENFIPEELEMMGQARRQLHEKKQELYAIRKELNSNMEHLDLWIKFFDIYAVPMLIILGLIINKRRFKCHLRKDNIKFNKQLCGLGLIAVLVLGLGICSYYIRLNESAGTPQDEELFAGLAQKINEVTEISIKNHQGELILHKDNGIWVNPAHKEFLVNQARVKNFLQELLMAKIYEKKSDRMEVMRKFGIMSLEEENSPTVEIALRQKNGEQILGFAVGQYDVELSRGAVGAYIKLPDQFQVWLAQIDLVDLSSDYHNWSYANLWSLQLGRIGSVNNSQDTDFIAKTVSILLNVPMEGEVKYIGYENLKLSLDMKGEYFDKLVMDFYEKDGKYYAHYYFGNIKGNEILQKFAQKMTKYYQIDKQYMEKISSVVEQK